MRLLGVEECSVLDCICQALDIVCPKEETKISLTDIKKCKQPSLFFNIFLNIQKFLDHELKDPLSNKVNRLSCISQSQIVIINYTYILP